ncbi:MAG: DUF3581 family protein [Pseudomonadales bacterium]
MNFLDPYLNRNANNQIIISANQACSFAKQVAGDFNPIHDADSKRFCVPGDLLFAIALNQYGLHSSMTFSFLEMLSADIPITYSSNTQEDSDSKETQQHVSTENGKTLLTINTSGDSNNNPETIAKLAQSYVQFSGQNFPHILVPLMQEQGVMINPARPLIIYKSMSFELDDVHAENISLRLDSSTLDVQGKRGTGAVSFSLLSNDKVVGKGQKNLILSGLREYDQSAITELSDNYLINRDKYFAR